MPATAVVTVILAVLIIAAAALGLIRVMMHLIATRRSLEGVIAGVEAVALKTATVPTVVASVNANLKPVRDFCEGI